MADVSMCQQRVTMMMMMMTMIMMMMIVYSGAESTAKWPVTETANIHSQDNTRTTVIIIIIIIIIIIKLFINVLTQQPNVHLQR